MLARQAFARADGVVGGASDVGRCAAGQPGIDMPATLIGPLGDVVSNKSFLLQCRSPEVALLRHAE
jgi:hypothetical protein